MGFCIEFTLFSYSLGFLTVKIHWGVEPLPPPEIRPVAHACLAF